MRTLACLPFAALCLVPQLAPAQSAAQAAPSPAHPTPIPAAGAHQDARLLRIFRLQNAPTQQRANDLLTAIRVILDPEVKMFLAGSDRIAVRANPEQMQQVASLVEQLDQPQAIYRITYTVTTYDANVKSGLQHFALLTAEGKRATLKVGSHVPVVDGNTVSYVDIANNFDVTPNGTSAGVYLLSIFESNSVAPDPGPSNTAHPVIRQARLEGTPVAVLGRPVSLGSIDVPDSHRRLEVEVLVEIVR